MVNDAVPVGGNADEARLRFADDEGAVRPWPIGLRPQFLVQLPQFPFQTEVEAGDVGAEALALARAEG
jgi:hypothetical protein